METIRHILEHILYIGITLPLTLSFLATVITDMRQLRDQAKGQGGEGRKDPRTRSNNTQNP